MSTNRIIRRPKYMKQIEEAFKLWDDPQVTIDTIPIKHPIQPDDIYLFLYAYASGLEYRFAIAKELLEEMDAKSLCKIFEVYANQVKAKLNEANEQHD